MSMKNHDFLTAPRPKSQLDADRMNALREAESAHKAWMDTSIFTEAGRLAKTRKDEAWGKYLKLKEAQ